MNRIGLQFHAKYLHAVVDRWLVLQNKADPRLPLFSAYLESFTVSRENQYLEKYLQSNRPTAASGKFLPRAVAEWLVRYETDITRILQSSDSAKPAVGFHVKIFSLLGTCLNYVKHTNEIDHGILKPTRDRLMIALHSWKRIGQHVPNLVALIRMAEVSLETIPDGASQMRTKQRNLRDSCALKSCGETINLKACSK